MCIDTTIFHDPWDVLLSPKFSHEARLEYLLRWRECALVQSDKVLAKRLAFAILEVRRALGSP